MTPLTRTLHSQGLYTPNYCEENIYNLVGWLTERKQAVLENLYVVFMSNENQTVPFWKQRKGSQDEEQFILWDYHVILIDQVSSLIWDLDSTLECPSCTQYYIEKALKPEIKLNNHLQRKYRLVPGALYIREFASDRSHMMKDCQWLAQPPSYPCIRNRKSEVNNLEKYLLMTSEDYSSEDLFGVIMDQPRFLLRINFQSNRNQEKDNST